MITIKNVLVTTDFSESSAVALDYGRELARTYQARLHVMHVVDDLGWRYSLEMTPEWLPGVQESVEESARARLADQLTDEDRNQLRARAVVRTAVAAPEAIVSYAKSEGIDVIVLGTHGRSGLAHVFMGSVAERVVRAAPCPVLTVRCSEHEFIAPDTLVAVAKT
jgi:nucleotide-binding universal stress UspA family protein